MNLSNLTTWFALRKKPLEIVFPEDTKTENEKKAEVVRIGEMAERLLESADWEAVRIWQKSSDRTIKKAMAGGAADWDAYQRLIGEHRMITALESWLRRMKRKSDEIKETYDDAETK